ncbi:glycosyltransferase family 2 protein [Cytophagales bacterium LB-30]|uniref:Glycosyltransferase family 2 protein n=1 Tax=Shiella aurantiaca TaxID=3058365 RepID=A0ABT8F2T3_9BACT|nr:glycosyltransferase family 2 protein [Shiella aurantiaca]MDN4164758.1 glycosyltransferase family 2 protein [Shiella aurantiaca]
MNNKVSILMPAYNASQYILVAVDSIVNQTYQNWELLICDDCSNDSTLELISKFTDTRIKIFQNAKNEGYLKTCNFLFKQASGQLITFQDADDWSNLFRIEKQVGEFVKDSALGICGTYAKYYNSDGTKATLEKKPMLTDEEIKREIINKSQFCGASIMIRDSVYQTVGGYRDWFDRIGNEDYDWSARIVENFKAINIPEFLYFVRQSEGSISRVVRSPRQLVSSQVVQQLINQRQGFGFDWLESGNDESLNKFELSLLEPFVKDPSLIYRKSADINWFNNNNKLYLFASMKAVNARPLVVLNWKYFMMSFYRYIVYKLFSNQK